MSRRFLFCAVSLVFISSGRMTVGAKNADLAGKWYSSSPARLRTEIESYLKRAKVPAVRGIGYIAPHAGLRFSGPIAAYTYKSAALSSPEVAVIIGFSHRKRFNGVSVFMDNEFITPLGAAVIDTEISGKLAGYSEMIRDIPEAFNEENSVEMQVPLAQVALKNSKLVLLCMGPQSYDNAEMVADALYHVLKDRKSFVIIGSTDMSHYLSYDDAVKKDGRTIGLVKKFNSKILYDGNAKGGYELMCGPGAVCATMLASGKLGANRVKILKYANSGDTSGNKSGVVGYLSVVFYKEDSMFNDDQRKELLRIARSSIEEYLTTGKRLEIDTKDEALKKDMGAFVTLHKNGRLRGCIGHMVAQEPICLTVRDMAIAAATQDPRFPSVSHGELKDIDIEISALSPMRKVDSYREIQLGKHGVKVQSGFRAGVYLPQVATETGWNLEQFMDSLCMDKAGIPRDSWKKGTCDISVFTAEVFGEKDYE